MHNLCLRDRYFNKRLQKYRSQSNHEVIKEEASENLIDFRSYASRMRLY